MKPYCFSVVIATILLTSFGLSTPSGANPNDLFSIGVRVGHWAPAMTAYNERFKEQNHERMVDYGEFSLATTIRESMADGPRTFLTGTSSEFTIDAIPFAFASEWTIGAIAEARIPLLEGLGASFEIDWWSQKMGSTRRFSGQIGYEEYEVALTPLILSVFYETRIPDKEWYWPTMRFGTGVGVLLFSRKLRQVVSLETLGKAPSEASGNSPIWTAQFATSVTPPQLDDRVSFSLQAQYITASYTEWFQAIYDTGVVKTDTDGNQSLDAREIVVSGPTINFVMTINFGREFVSADTQ
jgi:hypothetical protein